MKLLGFMYRLFQEACLGYYGGILATSPDIRVFGNNKTLCCLYYNGLGQGRRCRAIVPWRMARASHADYMQALLNDILSI